MVKPLYEAFLCDMENRHFYFIKDEFYEALSGCNLLTNKSEDVDNPHGRPCHYCFYCDEYYWMIPISSQVKKYKSIYDKKMDKWGNCDTIRFEYVNGEKRAFLIQNAFPVTEKYIKEEYKVHHNTIPVVANKDLSNELNSLIKKVIRLYKNGINMPLTKLSNIFDFLDS